MALTRVSTWFLWFFGVMAVGFLVVGLVGPDDVDRGGMFSIAGLFLVVIVLGLWQVRGYRRWIRDHSD